MRKESPFGLGNRKLDPKDSRIIASRTGELGDYLFLGQEGIDQDGDGLLVRIVLDMPTESYLGLRLGTALHPKWCH